MSKRHGFNRRGASLGVPAPAARTVPIRPVWLVVRFVPLLFGALLLWRLVLATPLLGALRLGTVVSFTLLHPRGSAAYITLDTDGDWMVHPSGLFLEREVGRRVGLVDPVMRASRQTLQVLTLSLPLFWALALSASPQRQWVRVLGIGTLLMAFLAQVSTVLLLAFWINERLPIASSGLGKFCLKLAANLVVQVVPFAAPFVVIIWLDRELRRLVFGATTPQK